MGRIKLYDIKGNKSWQYRSRLANRGYLKREALDYSAKMPGELRGNIFIIQSSILSGVNMWRWKLGRAKDLILIV